MGGADPGRLWKLTRPKKGSKMETLKLVKGVRSHLSRRENWYKGGYSPKGVEGISDGCVCLLGAVHLVANPDGDFRRQGVDHAIELTFEEALGKCVPEQFQNDCGDFVMARAAGFNDDPATTHEDVLKVLDCAIARLEGPVS